MSVWIGLEARGMPQAPSPARIQFEGDETPPELSLGRAAAAPSPVIRDEGDSPIREKPSPPLPAVVSAALLSVALVVSPVIVSEVFPAAVSAVERWPSLFPGVSAPLVPCRVWGPA